MRKAVMENCCYCFFFQFAEVFKMIVENYISITFPVYGEHTKHLAI
jgi:hypothetical protein